MATQKRMLPPPLWERVKNKEVDEPDKWNEYPTAQFPLQVTRRLIGDLWEVDGMPLIRHWRGDFHTWTGTHWKTQADEISIERRIWYRLEEVTAPNKDGNPVPWAPTPNKVSNLMRTLVVESHIHDDTDVPALIDENGAISRLPHRVVAMDNGVLDLKTREIHAHTPEMFNKWALPFNYAPAAECPRWQQFIGEVFAHDPAGALALQEYAGYLVAGRTDLQKALLIVGPPAGGKGTISHVLQQIMGQDNTVPISFKDLAENFGAESLIGKSLLIVEDARDDEDRHAKPPLERLLTIIADDGVSVNRKGKPYWNGRLHTRVAIFTNNIPSFKDPSGAILRRFLMVQLQGQFQGAKSDSKLKDKLDKELPGIFNWALDGLDRLEHQGHFTTPATAETVHAVMSDITSPLKMWIDEQDVLEVTGNPNDCVEERRVRESYNYWARSQERGKYTRERFVSQFQATFPMVQMKNTTPPGGGDKARYFFGIKDHQPHITTPW